MPDRKTRTTFVEPMLLLRTEKLPEGEDWLYEIKFDGYRALALKSAGKVQLRSRNDNDFSSRYRGITKALAAMPDETVIDGEIGRPVFRRCTHSRRDADASGDSRSCDFGGVNIVVSQNKSRGSAGYVAETAPR